MRACAVVAVVVIVFALLTGCGETITIHYSRKTAPFNRHGNVVVAHLYQRGHKVKTHSEESFYETPTAKELSGYCPKGVEGVTAVANQQGSLRRQLGTTELIVVCN